MFVIRGINTRSLSSSNVLDKFPAIKALADKYGLEELNRVDWLISNFLIEHLANIHRDYKIDPSSRYTQLATDTNVYTIEITSANKIALPENKAGVKITFESTIDTKKIVLTMVLSDTDNNKDSISVSPSQFVYYPNSSDLSNGIEVVERSAFDKWPFYYYTGAQFALDDFANEHIMVSRLSSIDDPNEWVAKFTKDGKELEVDEIRAQIQKKFNSKYGLISLSRNWNIEPMWGLYADKYKGVVLEFQELNSIAWKVQYKDTRFSCDQKDFGQFFPKIVSRKSAKWAFEEEYRIIVPLDPAKCTPIAGRLFVPIQVGKENRDAVLKLVRIICGPCISDENYNQIVFQQKRWQYIAKNNGFDFDVPITRTRLKKDGYELEEIHKKSHTI